MGEWAPGSGASGAHPACSVWLSTFTRRQAAVLPLLPAMPSPDCWRPVQSEGPGLGVFGS